MPPRKWHTKSRHGCRQCKKRKVKCDEARPVCLNCTRRGTECLPSDFIFSTSNSPDSTTKDGSMIKSVLQSEEDNGNQLRARWASQSPTENGNQQTPRSVHPSLNCGDLELMHHYSTQTYLTLPGDEPQRYIWQIVLPREAFAHEFLMHALLAFSATHLLSTEPESPKYESRYLAAIYHRDRALSSSISSFSNITEESCKSLVLFGAMVALLAFGLQRASGSTLPANDKEETRRHETIEGLVEVLTMIRGSIIVLESGIWDWIIESELQPVLDPPEFRSKGRLTPDIIDAFENLQKYASQSVTARDVDHASIYTKAIDNLKDTFELAAGGSVVQTTGSVAFRWPTKLNTVFLTALKELQPIPLAISAHYGVLLYAYSDNWWVGDQGRRLVEDIHTKLLGVDGEGSRVVEWALQKVHDE